MSHSVPGLTVLYGSVLDLTIATRDLRILIDEWHGWQMLVSERAMSSAPGRAKLYLVKGAIRNRAPLMGDEHDRAQEQYERWHLRDAESLGEIIDIPGTIAYRQGRVMRIGYRSDKWTRRGKHRDYDHDFTEDGHRPPWLYTNTRNIERARAAVIVGGDMAITEGGID